MPRMQAINSETRHVAGWVPDRPDHRDMKFVAGTSFLSRLLAPILAPAAVDLRKNCSSVESQGDLGSCTAHAATSAMEFLYKKAGKTQPELSRLFLYYATRVWVAGESSSADNGAMIRDVMRALAKHGVCIEKEWAYRRDRFSTEPGGLATLDAKNHQILHYYRCPNLKYIKACLAEGYPCVGGFAVPESVGSESTTKTGVIEYPGPKDGFMGGHAVLFVGYNDKTKRLMFQNSWGTKWGDGGYGYLPYAFVTNWLANDFWTIRRAEM